MSVDANALERETLERKDRDELQKIAGALGGKVTSRTRKADIIDMILELTGVTPGSDKAAEDQGGKSGSAVDGESPANGRSAADEAAAESDEAASAEAPRRREPQRSERQRQPQQRRAPQRDNDRTETDRGVEAERGEADRGEADRGEADRGGDDEVEGGGRPPRRRGRNREAGAQQDEYTGEPIPVVGCLDLRDDGYGFLRVDGLLPSKDDCYVSVKQVRQFGLRKGDVIAGGSRPAFRNEKNPAIVRIDTVNGVELEAGTDRPLFEDVAAVFASEPLQLVVGDGDVDNDERTSRALDLLAPIGKGSRVLLAAPPRTGKTSILQTIARAVEANEPDLSLVVVLLDERPEEITEMRRVVAAGDVHGSPFDASPDEHVAILDLALARARRMAESGDDVVVLIDGLTRIARAEHAAGQGSGRTVGGLDMAAIHAAKRAFGTGRNLEDAGSVTVVATATVDTGSEVDDAVYDAVVGGATTQIRLDRHAAERRSFPALDVGRTTTRREELLVGDDAARQREALRRLLAGLPDPESADHADPLDGLLGRLRDTKSNEDLLDAASKEETSR
jgi:transcription termination factor Rho